MDFRRKRSLGFKQEPDLNLPIPPIDKPMKPTYALWGFLAVSPSTVIHAATLLWDANSGTAPVGIDGGGIWTDALRFHDGTNNVTWPTGGSVLDIASFGNPNSTPIGLPGNITFTTAISAGGLQFNPYYGNAVKYNIAGGTGGILTLNGAPTITVNTRSDRPFASINAVLAGTAGFDLISSTGGIVEMGTQANTITGGFRLKAGSTFGVGGDTSWGGANNGLSFDGTATVVTRTTHTPAITHAISAASGATGKLDSLTGQTLTVASAISGAGSIQKEGLGGLTLTTGSTYAGSTGIRQGTLTLNFANATAPVAPTADIIPATSTLRLLGGTLSVTGKGATANTQTFAGTTLLPGISAVNSTAGATGTTAVNFGAITRNPGSILNVATIAAGTSYSTSSTNTNGILGGFAAVNFADWVSVGGGTFAPYTGYQTSGDTSLWAAADNVSIGATPSTPLAGSATINSLKFTGAADVAVPSGQTLTVTSGGLLVAGGPSSVSGGNLQGSVAGDIVVHQHAAANPFTISSAIIDNGGASGVTKGGQGTLILSGGNTYSGNTYLNSGTLEVSSDGNLGTGSTVTMRQSTTLRLAGSSAINSSKDFLFDFGSDSWGGAQLTDAPANAVGNFNIDVTNSAGTTISGNFNVPAGNFTKYGAGTLTLTHNGIHQLGKLNGGIGVIIHDGGIVFNGGANSEWRAGQEEFVIGSGSEATKTQSKEAVVTVQSGKVTVGSWTGIARGNGTANYQSRIVMTGGTWDTGNLSLGYAFNTGGYLTRPTVDLSNDAQFIVRDDALISESNGSTATINVANNATFAVRDEFRLALSGSAPATLNVSGNGIASGGINRIGQNGTAIVNLSGSGQLISTNNSNVGQGSSGTVNLTGSSQFNVGSFLNIGNGGPGVVNLGDTATVGAVTDFNIGDTDNSTGTLNITGGTANANTLYVGKGGNVAAAPTLSTRAVVNQSGGLLQNLSGGGGDWRIGGGNANDGEVWGAYILSGGTFNSGARNFQIGANGIGVMEVRGGTAITNTTGGFPVVARYGTGFGLLDVSSGSFSVGSTGQFLIVGENGNGSLNVSGTGSVVVNSLPTGAGPAGNGGGTGGLRMALAANASGTVSLNGGTLETSGIAKSSNAGTAYGYAYLNGGNLKAHGDNATFMQGLDGTMVGPNGAKIDTNGASITIGQNLVGSGTQSGVLTIPVSGGSNYMGPPVVTITGGSLNPSTGARAIANMSGGTVSSITITNPGVGITGTPTVALLGGGTTTPAVLGTPTFGALAADGGLTKSGTGVLTLGGANTYTGATTVNEGSLLVNGSIMSSVTAAAGADVGGSGAVNGNVTVDSTSFVEPGSTPTAAGTLVVNGNVTLPGTLHIQLDGATGDRLTVNGDLDLSGASLEVESLAGGATQGSYTIVSYTGNLTGSLTLEGSLPATYSLVNDVANKAIKLVSAGNYGAWQAGFGLTLGTTGAADADNDGDGLDNAVEYVLGSDPTTSSSASTPVQTQTPTDLVFTFNRADASETADTQVTVEVSTDLTSFPITYTIGSNTGNSSAGVTIQENGTSPDTVTVVVPRGSDPSKFIRLNVNILP